MKGLVRASWAEPIEPVPKINTQQLQTFFKLGGLQ